MKKENKNLSRRNFLATGYAIVASSVIAAEVNAAPSSNELSATTFRLEQTISDSIAKQ